MSNITRAAGNANWLGVAAAALAVVAWGACLWRASAVFGPDSAHVQPFNSDSALPVLMANDPVIDSFRTYIYGQDQIGAWPFLLCQLATRATGRLWTDRGVYLFQTVWLFLGLFAFAALGRNLRLAPAALLLAVLCLHPTVSHYLFVINQRNAWQATALFFAWWSLRRLLARGVGADSRGGRRAHAGARSSPLKSALLGPALLWPLAAFALSLLAAWTSPLSGPALCLVFALEVLRARADEDARAAEPRLPVGRLLACALPLAAALACEQLLKFNYHRHALKHYGKDFRTPVEFDWGHLLVNFKTQLKLLAEYPQWPLTALAVLAAPALIILLVRCATGGPARRPVVSRSVAQLDLCALSLGCVAVAAVNFASTVVFSWTRLNAYGPRYLALTHLFGTLAGLLVLLLLLSLPARVYAARRVVFPAVAVACLLLVAFAFPPARREPEYDRLKGVADELARRAPGAVLLGGFWDTYVFAALRPDARLVPVPAEDQFVRTPWSPAQLRRSTRVLVVHHVFPASTEIETPGPYATFGDGREPPRTIRQHGATLELAAPRVLEINGYTFTLYDNRTAREVD
jgi:hypothetical protein